MTNIKEKTIGVVGGAGPMAGALLVKKIIESCQRLYGCISDDDYPKIILLSYPFSQMLKLNDEQQYDPIISKQLKSTINFLNKCQANYICIACNTLHGFLNNSKESKQFINLVTETQSFITKQKFKRVLILCTSTSVKKNVYGFQNMESLDKKDQGYIDGLISTILEGNFSQSDSFYLKDFILSKTAKNSDLDAVLLGCTELSVLIDEYPFQLPKIHLINPMDILATKLCRLTFD